MGVDIVAYKNLTKVNDPKRDAYGSLIDWEILADISQSTIDYTEECFKGRTSGLVAAVYKPSEANRYTVGTCTYYNKFRDKLASIATNYQLYELIEFSDSEGYIGPEVSAKLAVDFQNLENDARAILDEREMKLYLNFKEAFEMAAENGCVEFR